MSIQDEPDESVLIGGIRRIEEQWPEKILPLLDYWQETGKALAPAVAGELLLSFSKWVREKTILMVKTASAEGTDQLSVEQVVD